MITPIGPHQILSSYKQNRRKTSSRESALKSVIITVDGAVFRFDSVDGFSAAIEGRTSIPTALFSSLSTLESAALTVLAKTLKSEEKLLIEVLERTLTSPGTLGREINRIPVDSFREDHFWREIIISLNESEAGDSYLQTAFVKYLQFLNSYQEVVRLLYAISPSSENFPTNADSLGAESAPYETALFDVLQYSDAGRMVNPYRRLPQGEAVTLHALPGHAINLLLAKYSFELVNSNGWVLIDSRNRRHPLANDLNYVGRGRENDVALNSDYHNVSRKHVIIHPLDDSSIVLIDLSSHGTFVPPRQVDLNINH